eukprot:Gb_16355 [translate_table: standard]
MGSNGTEKPSVQSRFSSSSSFDDDQHRSTREQLALNTDRHEHPLVWREGLGLYTCNGCKEYGAAKAFYSSLDKERQFTFRPKSHLRHHCQACGDVMRGFMFESGGMRLHPYCMKLPTSLNYSGHPAHRLELILESKSSADKCTVCGEKIKGWMYTCREISCRLKVKVDMSCAKVDFHGLGEHGTQRASPEAVSKKIERRAKPVASQMGSIIAGVLPEDEDEDDHKKGDEDGGGGGGSSRPN